MQHEDEAGAQGRPLVSRRGFMTLAAGGMGAIALGGVSTAAFAADPSPTPKLPGEYFRKPNQLTAAGTLFDNICVRINGDVARIHVPQTVKPFTGQAVPVVWFYHGAGSDHNALDGGFKLVSAAVVDHGWVAICQTAGGSLYSHPTAQALQVAGYNYMRNTFTISTNVLRATSGGGALANETYASKLVGAGTGGIAGMYNVNATYDIRAHYDQGGDSRASIVAAFGDDPAAIDAANPARYGAGAWAGSIMRIVVSQPSETDLIVPPDDHGLKLLALASPVAAEATMRAHSNGHSTPGFALPDFIATMERWVAGATGGDVTPPKVSIVSPTQGAIIKGYATATVVATDNVGVVDVGIFHGESRLLTLTQQSSTQWGARIWTAGPRTPNGNYTITARAFDAAGNVGVSAPVDVRIAN